MISEKKNIQLYRFFIILFSLLTFQIFLRAAPHCWQHNVMKMFQLFLPKASQQYHLINSQRSWYDAQKFCRVKYTDLATVGNMDDNDELLTVLGHDWTYSWIGLQKGGARRWMWSDGSGQRRSTSGMAVNLRPDRENCAAFSVPYKGRWVDAQCNQENTFICQGGEYLIRKLNNFSDLLCKY
uniref:C-type lectin domain-containing protein n=1 Tax=Labrus bergylta TaxID=56723 RepID=A0A3Q3FGT1_9LABR